MADNSKKISELPLAANVAATDRILVLRSPSQSPSVRTVDFSTLSANITLSNTVPANSSSNGLAGTICYDSDYIYICVANNTWKKASISSW